MKEMKEMKEMKMTNSRNILFSNDVNETEVYTVPVHTVYIYYIVLDLEI